MRIPFDEEYVQTLGEAVYAFAYYEWTIIYIIERLEPGFVGEYSRGVNSVTRVAAERFPMTSGVVAKRLGRALSEWRGNGVVPRSDLESCRSRFRSLVDKRNALIHSHPITDMDGAQVLNFQTKIKKDKKVRKAISDMKWGKDSVRDFAQEVDSATVQVSRLFAKL